jgi:hypothetical protein
MQAFCCVKFYNENRAKFAHSLKKGFDSRQGEESFLLYTASGPALDPFQPPIQWVPGTISPGVKWTGRVSDH